MAGSQSSNLSHWFSRRMLVILVMGFASGLPIALTASTLQAWMATEKVDLKTIGFFSLVGLPYTVKFLWAPILDRFDPLGMGRRRTWILLCQVFVLLAVLAMSVVNPVASPVSLALLAFLVAFFSASLDIAIDAFRTESLLPEEWGLGAGISTAGYRVAMLTSGALALILSDHLPWSNVYQIMAGCMAIGLVASFFAEEPQVASESPRSLKDAVLLPLLDFLKRKGVIEISLFILIYKLDAVIAFALVTPFLKEVGFTNTDIGIVLKFYGFFAAVGGTLIGGALMMKLGLLRSLVIFGVLQALAGGTFLLLSFAGPSYPLLVAAVSAENMMSGMGNAAYAAFIMSLCNQKFTATQYALLSGLMACTRIIFGAPMGSLAESVGWHQYFIISIVAGIPGLLMLFRFNKWQLGPTSESPR